MPEAMIQADGLVKIYKTKQTEVLALQGLDLRVDEGELTAIIGNSGSGKSTFLNMIGGLDRPSAGSLFVGGKNLFTMTPYYFRTSLDDKKKLDSVEELSTHIEVNFYIYEKI